MKDLKISVRRLVEFILRSGDIRSGGLLSSKESMLEGGRIHRKLQRSMGSTYRAEVPLSFTKKYDGFTLTIEGRADGIYRSRGRDIIDEIKGTYSELDSLEEPVPVHLAQACCYAFIYADENGRSSMKVQVRYCSFATERIKKFSFDYTFEELKTFFEDVLEKYYRFALHMASWDDIRNSTITGLEFPFAYRKGQKELTADVYRAVRMEAQLFVQAATGTGKTMSVVFPAVHALGTGLAEKIFYLTAKTITGTAPSEALNILRSKGLRIKSICMTAKEKLCPCDEVICDAAFCERARGHFDRVNDVLYEMLSGNDAFSREMIETAAEKACVCPYELQLDLSEFCDIVIGDYNYAFDPEARLKRFFAAGSGKGKYVFLIDEAHNLVGRAREMFSAILCREDILAARRLAKGKNEKLYKALGKCSSLMLEKKKQIKGSDPEKTAFDDRLAVSVLNAAGAFEEMFQNSEDDELKKELLRFYFDIRHFLTVSEMFDENYIVFARSENEKSFMIKLLCVDPSVQLQKTIDLGRSSVMFSATLLPVRYYQELLSDQERYSVYVPSPFEQKNRLILIGTDVSSRYTVRGPAMYAKYAEYLRIMISQKRGRYMAYFPSYTMMNSIFEEFLKIVPEGAETVIQDQGMSEADREAFLDEFSADSRWLLGFCVLGGIFSEGIDLTGDRLIGAAVIGTGIPQISGETDLLKNYYSEKGYDGFDHAYKYPGFNKVMQAAGRVIRTAEDRGVILLLDERFTQSGYRNIFPKEWSDAKTCSMRNAAQKISGFWNGTDSEIPD